MVTGSKCRLICYLNDSCQRTMHKRWSPFLPDYHLAMHRTVKQRMSVQAALTCAAAAMAKPLPASANARNRHHTGAAAAMGLRVAPRSCATCIAFKQGARAEVGGPCSVKVAPLLLQEAHSHAWPERLPARHCRAPSCLSVPAAMCSFLREVAARLRCARLQSRSALRAGLLGSSAAESAPFVQVSNRHGKC